MARLGLICLAAAVSAFAQSGLERPVIGQFRDSDGRMVRILGAPGALMVEETPEGDEWVEAGWLVEQSVAGALLVRQATAERYLLPRAVQSLQLFVFTPPDTETPVAGLYAFPTTPAGGAVEVRFRVRNTSTAAVEVNRVFIAPGAAFKVSNVFPIPRTLGAGGFGEIRVVFAPPSGGAFQGELQINDTTWKLTGSSTAQAGVERYDGSSWKGVAVGTAIDFGRIPPGGESVNWFRLTAAATAGPKVEGECYSLAWAGEGFRITCRPEQAGLKTGKLIVDAGTWPLTAQAEEEEPPVPSLAPLLTSVDSGAQQEVAIALATPSKRDLTGTLRLEFEPERSGLGDDAAVAFVPSLSRSVGFNVAKGAVGAAFAEGSRAAFQTGSTAGWIILRIELGAHRIERRIRVAPQPVLLTGTTAALSTNLAEVVVRGIDNTRSAKRIGFIFRRKDGSVAGEFDMPVDQVFAQYYAANPKAGGVFQLRAQFPVSGDASQLESVSATLTNESGARETGVLRF